MKGCDNLVYFMWQHIRCLIHEQRHGWDLAEVGLKSEILILTWDSVNAYYLRQNGDK